MANKLKTPKTDDKAIITSIQATLALFVDDRPGDGPAKSSLYKALEFVGNRRARLARQATKQAPKVKKVVAKNAFLDELQTQLDRFDRAQLVALAKRNSIEMAGEKEVLLARILAWAKRNETGNPKGNDGLRRQLHI